MAEAIHFSSKMGRVYTETVWLYGRETYPSDVETEVVLSSALCRLPGMWKKELLDEEDIAIKNKTTNSAVVSASDIKLLSYFGSRRLSLRSCVPNDRIKKYRRQRRRANVLEENSSNGDWCLGSYIKSPTL